MSDEVESIGAIKVSNMILTATVLTLGSLGICVHLCSFSGIPQLFKIPPSWNRQWSTPTLSSLE